MILMVQNYMKRTVVIYIWKNGHINQVNPHEILKEIRHDHKCLLMSKILTPERERKRERESKES